MDIREEVQLMGKKMKLKASEVWDSMSSEERVCHPRLQYLAEAFLLKNWEQLPEYVQNHLIILLS